MLRLYNTLTGEKDVFKPIEEGHVKLYDCGPTVYWYQHIGNYSRYFMSDLLRRYLEYKGLKVTQVMNITDVGHLTQDDIDEGEDKIMLAAKKEGLTPLQIAEKYTEDFLENLTLLRIQMPHTICKATDHIKEMVETIGELEEKAFVYKITDGMYFKVQNFPSYGSLSGNTLENLKAGARIDVNPEKEHPADFALWKFVPEEHILKWDSPWGSGCPGWHIECSVMARKYLGDQVDIHTGGWDNKFPHHESEIAQIEPLTGKRFVNYWMHCHHLLVDGEKMSKSLGNIYRPVDIVEKGYDILAFRYLILSTHYRNQTNFTFDSLKAAQSAIDRVNNIITALNSITDTGDKSEEVAKILQETRTTYNEALDDDLNTPEALAAVFELIKKINPLIQQKSLISSDAETIVNFLKEVNQLFDVFSFEKTEHSDEVKDLIAKREEARKNKDYELADQIRDQLTSMGVEIRDTKA